MNNKKEGREETEKREKREQIKSISLLYKNGNRAGNVN